VVVVPFLLAASFFAAVIGKVAMLEWLGLKNGGPFRRRAPKTVDGVSDRNDSFSP